MGVQDLQTVFESEGISVDLFRIGRNHTGGFRVVVDAEGCLDRLYGGYFSDWACGGQWARCVQFFISLKNALMEHQVTVCFCFDGSHPSSTGNSVTAPARWVQQQTVNRQRINNVLRHIASKGTPPPKVWWVPPAGLHSCLRSALRHMNVPVMVSTDDHHLEVVGLCRERGYAGILGCAGEYLAFQPPRYFCSSRLKLTYRSSLETKEYMVHDLAKWLSISQEKISVVAALLGNIILTEQHLQDFHRKLDSNQKKGSNETLVHVIANYVKEFQTKDIDALCTDVFGNMNDPRCALLKQSIQYYVNGTKEGFSKYKNSSAWKQKNKRFLNNATSKEIDMDTSRLASEANKPEVHELGTVSSAGPDWSENLNYVSNLDNRGHEMSNIRTQSSTINPKENIKNSSPFPIEVLRTCAERHTKGLMSPALLTILLHRQITLPVLLEDENHRELPSIHHLFRPIRQNVYAILFNMHHYHYMATRSKDGEKTGPPPPINVSEWIYTKRNPGKSPDIVPGVMLDWPVPTVQRLWFGTAQDDKNRRIRAFLSCMRSENPLMTNIAYVPHHLLLLATVLRYIMTSPIQCLRRQELDAFLATAFASDLTRPLTLQEMTLSSVTVRGVQLGALLMAGIEAALLANDACGAPIWWPFTSPWFFFDGKLFQHKLDKANSAKNLVQLCDNQVDVVIKVERMRKAILEGLDVEFAMPPLPMPPNVLGMAYPPPSVINWPQKGRGGMNTNHRSAGGRLEVAGIVVGQWGANYARSAQARYPPQIGYTPYTSQHNTYPSRGRGMGRGRGLNVGNRGGLNRRTRHRTTRPTAPKRRTENNSTVKDPSINGKITLSDDTKPINGTNEELIHNENSADNVNDASQQEQTSDNGELPDSQTEANSNGVNKTTKIGRNAKKAISKNKKKGGQKTDAPAKSDDTKINNDGHNCENTILGINNKVPTSKSVAIVNGDNGSKGDHKGQNDTVLEN